MARIDAHWRSIAEHANASSAKPSLAVAEARQTFRTSCDLPPFDTQETHCLCLSSGN